MIQKFSSKVIASLSIIGFTASALVFSIPFSSIASSKTASIPTKAAVQKEGKLVTYGMPKEWANYGDSYAAFTKLYGIPHEDTDMTSAEELSKFKAEKNKPVADLGDIGIIFGSYAKAQNIVQPYKNKYWNEVPDWAKDKDGYWTAAYTGSIAMLVNKKLVKNIPHSFKDLLKAEYKNEVVVGDMQKAAQSQNTLLAAAFAYGGDEGNLQPGIDYFKKLKSAGNLKDIDNKIGNFQKGEIPIGFLWDFNALGYKYAMSNPDDYAVVVPSDGTVMSAYVSVINKYAPHPNAAKAFQEYLFSDEGQINLAKGFAKPIRNIKLPAAIQNKMLPASDYKSAKQIKDFSVWDKTSKEIPDLWRDNILAQ